MWDSIKRYGGSTAETLRSAWNSPEFQEAIAAQEQQACEAAYEEVAAVTPTLLQPTLQSIRQDCDKLKELSQNIQQARETAEAPPKNEGVYISWRAPYVDLKSDWPVVNEVGWVVSAATNAVNEGITNPILGLADGVIVDAAYIGNHGVSKYTVDSFVKFGDDTVEMANQTAEFAAANYRYHRDTPLAQQGWDTLNGLADRKNWERPLAMAAQAFITHQVYRVPGVRAKVDGLKSETAQPWNQARDAVKNLSNRVSDSSPSPLAKIPESRRIAGQIENGKVRYKIAANIEPGDYALGDDLILRVASNGNHRLVPQIKPGVEIRLPGTREAGDFTTQKNRMKIAAQNDGSMPAYQHSFLKTKKNANSGITQGEMVEIEFSGNSFSPAPVQTLPWELQFKSNADRAQKKDLKTTNSQANPDPIPPPPMSPAPPLVEPFVQKILRENRR